MHIHIYKTKTLKYAIIEINFRYLKINNIQNLSHED